MTEKRETGTDGAWIWLVTPREVQKGGENDPSVADNAEETQKSTGAWTMVGIGLALIAISPWVTGYLGGFVTAIGVLLAIWGNNALE